MAALHATDLLDSPPEPAFDRLTNLARRLLDVPVILISLVDVNRQFFKSAVGLCEPWASRRETPLSHSFCQHVVGVGEPLVIEDARRDPLVRDNAAITDLNVVAYLGVPLIGPGGHVLGSLCAIDHVPRAWTAKETADLTDLAGVAAVEIAARQHLERREQSRQQMHVLVDELDHRIRNLLTVVQAIARQTGSSATDVEHFVDAFCGRLGGLASAHAALMQRDWRGAGLRQIALGALQPHLGEGRIRIELPDTELEPRLALAFALLLHELATNAIKHGALSSPGGRVTLAAGPDRSLIWREEGGPPVEAPATRGFGSRLLQTALAPYGGTVELEWHPDGLVCRLRLPEPEQD